MHSCESIAHTKLHWGRDNMQLSNVQYLHQSKQNGSFREEGYGAFRRTTCCSGKGKWFRQRCACYYLGDLWTGELTASSIQKKKKIQTKTPPPYFGGWSLKDTIFLLTRGCRWLTNWLDFTEAFESSKSHHLVHADNDFLLPSKHFSDHFWELKKNVNPVKCSYWFSHFKSKSSS